MAFQVSPGINVTERDLTTIVPSVATTIAGFAGSFAWGPADEVILVDSPKNYRSLFGDPYNWNAETWFTGANFLGYGRNLLVVRRCDDNAKNAAAAEETTVYVPNDGVNLASITPNKIIARFPGNLGNSLRVSIAGNTMSSSAQWPVGTPASDSDSYFAYFRRSPSSTDNLVALAGTTTNDQIHVLVIDDKGLFTGNPGEVLEKFEGVSLHPEAKSLDGTSTFWKNYINERSRFIRITGSVDTYDGGTISAGGGVIDQMGLGLVSNSGYVFTWDNTNHVSNASDELLAGGTGEQVTTGSYATSTFDSGKGYDLFADPESVDVSLILGANIHQTNEVKALKDLVQERRDCVLFLSCPIDGTKTRLTDSEKTDQCVTFANTTVGSSSYVVVDSGYKKMFDPYNQVNRWVPLNGDVAGICARTDYAFDPWFSPAGLNRGQVRNTLELAFNPNQTYRDRLYPEGINPVVDLVGEGTILFGDKTNLSKPSAFDRINVRRLFIVLEKAIAAASKFSLFEFNDAFTRQQFRSLVEPFLRDVKARRGIFDFKVVCDETNNAADVVDRNEFVADIYIKPTRSINYIKLNFIATRSGVNFEEVGA